MTKKASDVIISEIMSSNFRWVEPETELEDAIQKMLNNNIRRLVILDDSKLIGVITQTDLTGFLRDKLLVDKTIKNIQKKLTCFRFDYGITYKWIKYS